MEITCPNCEKQINNIEYEDLPERACDENDIECPYCYAVMQVGWYLEPEVRGHYISSIHKENGNPTPLLTGESEC